MLVSSKKNVITDNEGTHFTVQWLDFFFFFFFFKNHNISTFSVLRWFTAGIFWHVLQNLALKRNQTRQMATSFVTHLHKAADTLKQILLLTHRKSNFF